MIESTNTRCQNSFIGRRSSITSKGLLYVVGLLFAFSSLNLSAQEQQSTEKQLLLPDDLEVSQRGKDEVEEYRVGGRLERLTIRKNNGFTEVYQNNSNSTLWYSEEENLGDLQNVRQWKLGTW